MTMGLIKATVGAAGGVLADQWRDYIYGGEMNADVLVMKGKKRTSRRSSNTDGEDNIISNGSIVAVNEGQAMIIVEQGKVVDLCAEPGEYVYDRSTEPSLFTGNLSQSIKDVFHRIGRRFTFGGDTGNDQRVYYFNTKEIVGNKYGTPGAIPFRVVDRRIGLDVDIAVKCFGEYSYRLDNPILFYTNVCGNVDEEYTRDRLDGQLKTEFMTALQPAFARISEMGIRYSALPAHTMELAQSMNEVLSEKWKELRGIEVVSVGVSSVKASEEDEQMIKDIQRNAAFRDPTMAAANLAGAQADAMKTAAANEGGMGAMGAFMGVGMAQQAGGANAAELYRVGAVKPTEPKNGGTWICSCGTENTGKFCENCGKPRPGMDSWICPACGTENHGNFCTNCGKKRPEEWVCSHCGTRNKGSFCTECGQKRDE